MEIICFFCCYGSHLTSDVEQKNELRENANTLKHEIVSLYNKIIKSYETNTQKRVVIIVDDLEKITNQKQILDVFHQHSRLFKSLNTHVILTMPPSLKYSQYLNLISRHFDRIFFLPLFEVVNKQGVTNADQIREMLQIARKRIPKNLLSDTLSEFAAIHSGGVINDFLRLLKDSCNKANVDNKHVIEDIHLESSFNDLIEFYRESAGQIKINILQKIHQTKNASIGKYLSDMLCQLVVLEYNPHGNNNWYDVHPAVVQLLINDPERI